MDRRLRQGGEGPIPGGGRGREEGIWLGGGKGRGRNEEWWTRGQGMKRDSVDYWRSDRRSF